MNLAPPLPTLQTLPIIVILDSAFAYLVARTYHRNTPLFVMIVVIRGLAETLFYQFFNSILKGKDLKSQRIFIVTSTIVNWGCFIALKELNLIGKYFSCILGYAITGHLFKHIRYLQEQEKRSMTL